MALNLPRVSIVIPVFNQLALTRQCLARLKANTPPCYELIVVNNGSSDGTAAFLMEEELVVLSNDLNLGFARACNQGAAKAQGQYLCFLNNDTEPLAGWLEPLLAAFEQDPAVGITGSKLLYPDGTLQHAGMLFGANRLPYHRGRGWPRTCFSEPEALQSVTGACLMIPRALFAERGGFDESFRNGFEDVDLCLKVRQSGRSVSYQPASVLLHHESKTEGRKDHMLDNQRLFLERWATRIVPDDTAYVRSLGWGRRLRHAVKGWLQRFGLGRTWLKERLGLMPGPRP